MKSNHLFGTSSYRSGGNNAETALKRYRYVGKERDEETGLYYYGARYYAGWLARFVSVDPLKDEYPFYTPYQYAGNRPIIAMDLDGLEPFKVTDEIAGIDDPKEGQKFQETGHFPAVFYHEGSDQYEAGYYFADAYKAIIRDFVVSLGQLSGDINAQFSPLNDEIATNTFIDFLNTRELSDDFLSFLDSSYSEIIGEFNDYYSGSGRLEEVYVEDLLLGGGAIAKKAAQLALRRLVPQGVSRTLFRQVSKEIRNEVKKGIKGVTDLGDDIAVQGSRAKHTAKDRF